MNIMKFVEDFKKVLEHRTGIPRFSKKKKSEEDAPISSVSMKDGDHGTIFSINRKIVITAFIGFLAMFVVAFIVASSSDSKPQNPNQAQMKKQEAAVDPHDSGELPDSYSKLIGTDKKVMANSQNPKTGQQTVTATRQNPGQTAASTTSLPAIPANNGGGGSYSAPYSLPYALAGFNQQNQQPAQPTVVTAAKESPEDAEEKSLAQRMKSAINFALNGITGGNSGQSSADGDAGAQAAANSSRGNTAEAASNISYSPPDANTVQAGTVIPAVLCSGINTDMGGGQVIAQIQADVYDSATGQNLLIPAGSRVLGTYDGGKADNGRISVTFNTLILPDGGSYNIGNSLTAMDGAGYSGIAGRVNRHTGRVLSSGMISSAIAAMGSLAAGNTSISNNSYSAGQLATQGAMANLMNSASTLFKQGASVAATTTVEPGYEFSVYVTQGIRLINN